MNRPAGNKLTWRFVAPNVHDFVWAADPEFIHKSRKVNDSVTFICYTNQLMYSAQWEKVLTDAERAFAFHRKNFWCLSL